MGTGEYALPSEASTGLMNTEENSGLHVGGLAQNTAHKGTRTCGPGGVFTDPALHNLCKCYIVL